MRIYKGSKEIVLPISQFEETCMWMSYRYAIGRHTIASTMHANDIANHFFYRLPNDRKMFTAFDIAREIDDSLRWKYNLFIEYPNVNENYRPLEILMDFIKKYDIHNMDEFNKFARIDYNCSTKEFKVKYVPSYVDAYHSSPDGSEQKEQYEKTKSFSTMDIEDLMHWQKLAACFDVEHLKVVKTVHDGVEAEHICFKSYWLQYGTTTEISNYNGQPYEVNDLNNIWWEEHWVPVERYVGGTDGVYIADDYVVSVRDITDTEIKQFEKYDETRK